nr:phospholipid carrier-dependent glycosyltransferase [Vampirovibrio sp.]
GKGYKLIHLVTQPEQVKYPILFPLLLAVGWLINPNFPQNLVGLTWMPLSFFLSSLVLMYVYFKHVKHISGIVTWIILLLTAGNFYSINFSTAVMSEAPYLFFSLLTLLIAEKYLNKRPEEIKPQLLGLLTVSSALAFHTRTVGIALMAAIGLWLLLNQHWRQFLYYSLGAFCLTLLPWSIWCWMHSPKDVNEVTFPIAYAYGGYGIEFLMNLKQGVPYHISIMQDSIGSLINALANILFPILSNLPAVFSLEESKWMIWGYLITLAIGSYGLFSVYLFHGIHAVKSRRYSVSGLYVALYILMIVLWNYENQMNRFLVVLLPWLWFILFKPWHQWTLSFKKEGAKSASALGYSKIRQLTKTIGLCLVVYAASCIIPNGYHFLHRVRTNHFLDPRGIYPTLWAEYKELFQKIRQNTQPKDVLAVEWSALFYLYTDRPTLLLSRSVLPHQNGQMMLNEATFKTLMKSFTHYDIKYMALEPYIEDHKIKHPANPPAIGLLDAFPESFIPVASSSNKHVFLFQKQ